MVNEGSGAIFGISEKIGCGLAMANKWSDPPVQIIMCFAFGVPGIIAAMVMVAVYFSIFAVPLVWVALYAYYQLVFLATPPAECEKYITFKDNELKKRWAKNKIPMHLLVEEFLKDNLEFKLDILETLENHREEFIDWRPNWKLMQFLIDQLFPSKSSSYKSVEATTKEIAEHYDRGNGFFNAFLGEMMIYTSAFYHGTDQSLEQAQKNKLNMICEKMHLFKPGMRHLDIGCGWGTLVRWSAKEFGAKSIGVTLSKQGAKWCRDNNTKEKLAKANEKDELKQGQCEILVCDYREVPSTLAKQNPSKSEEELLFDVISAVEMAEHVGIANFQLFLTNCRDMLKDEGLFYMQVAGLRKGSNWQDTQWGLFMSRYIFPGADASTPLFWYVKQLEMAGFEVKSVETVGRHYSHTLKAWYMNWMKNKDDPAKKEMDDPAKRSLKEVYGGTWTGDAQLPHVPGNLYRLWDIFLAWSTVAAGIGSATCYQIIAHKNTYTFPRDQFCTAELAKRSKKML